MKNYSIAIIFLIYHIGFGQSNTIQTDFFYGTLIEHDKSLNTAIQNNPFGFSVQWNQKSSNASLFNTLYNAPDRGFTFLYENFNSTILGEGFAGYRHFIYNLNPQKKNPLKLTMAFGLAYTTHPYNALNNSNNFAFGSKLLVSAMAKLQYYHYYLNQHLAINTGVSLIHFSNIGFKNPNLGINTVALHIGALYHLNSTIQPTIKPQKKLVKQPSKLNYYLILRGGYNESLTIGSGLHPFYTVSFYVSKKINFYSSLTAGIDFFNSTFLKKYIQDKKIEDGIAYNENNYRRAGIFIGHELTQNKFQFISQLGYSFYYPFKYVSRIYERFGFKYKLSNHIYSEITMKVNLFRAEALELGIGYKF